MSSQHHDSPDVSTAPKASEKRGKTRAKASSERTAALAPKPNPATAPKAAVAGTAKPKPKENQKRKPGALAEQNRRTQQRASGYSAELIARLPRRFQDRRESAGLSMYALSMKCGVGRSTISELESGDRVPRLPVIFCLIDGLDWTADAFFDRDMQG